MTPVDSTLLSHKKIHIGRKKKPLDCFKTYNKPKSKVGTFGSQNYFTPW